MSRSDENRLYTTTKGRSIEVGWTHSNAQIHESTRRTSTSYCPYMCYHFFLNRCSYRNNGSWVYNTSVTGPLPSVGSARRIRTRQTTIAGRRGGTRFRRLRECCWRGALHRVAEVPVVRPHRSNVGPRQSLEKRIERRLLQVIDRKAPQIFEGGSIEGSKRFGCCTCLSVI
jgi:hypothetical protein